MIIKADQYTCFVFDLDDTLYNEIDYLKSAYRFISEVVVGENNESLYQEMLKIYFSGRNTFEFILNKYPEKNITLKKLLYLYRNHRPDILLREGVSEMLKEMKNRNAITGIITDGRSITQRNKIKALGLENVIDTLIISEEFGCEKPSPALFESLMINPSCSQYYYFGDNLNKDFISPKKLGWFCIGILNSNNIRNQNISEFSDDFLPHVFIKSMVEIGII
jgi:putative hydrolase of the HAD superfamily